MILGLLRYSHRRIISIGELSHALSLAFAQGKQDTASLKGSIELPIGYKVANLGMQLDIGSVAVAVALNKTGSGVSSKSTIKLSHTGKASNPFWQMNAQLKGNFDSLWATDGLTNGTVKNRLIMLPIWLLLETNPPEVFFTNKLLKYSTTIGKTGTAK